MLRLLEEILAPSPSPSSEKLVPAILAKSLRQEFREMEVLEPLVTARRELLIQKAFLVLHKFDLPYYEKHKHKSEFFADALDTYLFPDPWGPSGLIQILALTKDGIRIVNNVDIRRRLLTNNMSEGYLLSNEDPRFVPRPDILLCHTKRLIEAGIDRKKILDTVSGYMKTRADAEVRFDSNQIQRYSKSWYIEDLVGGGQLSPYPVPPVR